MAAIAFPAQPLPRPGRHLWTGRFRLYVNSFREAPYIWSIDDGDPAHEVKCTTIHMEGIAMSTGTCVTPGYTSQPEDQKVAKAWIEGTARVMMTIGDEIYLDAV